MKALQQIIRRVAENPSDSWALATLVQAWGSTYRKPGARMLVDSGGDTVGVLSGGCLGGEVGRPGRNVIRDGSPLPLLFDTRRVYWWGGRAKSFVWARSSPGGKGKPIFLFLC